MTPRQTRILIATPAYGRQVTTDYLLSVRDLEAAFRGEGIRSELSLTHGSVLSRSRAALASIVLQDRSFSHLLFVDADMGFRPQAVLKLLRAERPLCGCLYPSRGLDYNLMHQAARSEPDIGLARSKGNRFISIEALQRDEHGELNIVDGFVRTRRIGFGLTLIRRDVLDVMRERLPDLLLRAGTDPAYTEMGVRRDVLQVFESVQTNNGLFLGEDLSFCHRWIEDCGGQIWACVDEQIAHVGANAAIGRAIDVLSPGA